jgi:murein DD-endopeptidase MepM/ murein hydrolase activator NlpD
MTSVCRKGFVELKKDWIAAGEKLMSRVGHALEHHPKHVTALVAALMLGGAGGAFAVASASAQPEIDPSLLPVREVLETVQPAPLAPQAEALDAFQFNLHRTDASRSSDTAEALLARLGIIDPAAADFLRKEAAFRTHVLGNPGRTVTAEASDSQHLVKLSARWVFDKTDRFNRLVIERAADGRFTSRIETAALVPSLQMASGVLKSSYFEAMDDAGVSESVARQVLGIFEGNIDFNRGLKVGDRFNVVYESMQADGEPMRTGRVISAEFVNAGKMHQAMWYQEPGREGGYFDMNGQSLERSFLASPMETTRITSGFAKRFHPVLHEWKQHKGVDYGGPIGTAVRTIGDGKVRWAGPMGAYGNLVVVDHGEGDETFYAHLSRIDVKPEQVVRRGQTIGGLGATGRVTGPHLHFEFRENGEHKDPVLALRNNQAPELSTHAKADFNRLSRALRSQFAAANTAPVVASAQ